MIFDKHRFEIWSLHQHPYKHTLSDFAYNNSALPGVTDVNAALNWLVKVLYPNTKTAVANVAALPLLGNTINDYRVVLDDGDGKQAGYRWEQREGEVSPSWHKVFDFDWSTDSILAAFMDITQDLYVYQKGKSDLDSSGSVVVGVYAGQTIYGGNQANQNLTFRANSGDGVGPRTGYVQVDDNFRPAVDNTFSLGTATERFTEGRFSQALYVNTMVLQTGQITDSTGQISFDNENLVTTGDITGSVGFFTTRVEVGPLVGDALVLAAGSITDESGAISFSNENLSGTGTLSFGVITTNNGLNTLVFDAGAAVESTITSSLGQINFGVSNLITTGTLQTGDATVTKLSLDDLLLDANKISITTLNTDLQLQANGTGVVDVLSTLNTLDQVVTGTVTITGQLNVDSLRIDGTVLSATAVNANVTITPNGTGYVEPTASVIPSSDNNRDLGAPANRFSSLYLGTQIGDGTNVISMATLLSFRSALVGAAAGMTLFYDGSQWLASVPDTEVDHGTISGLADDDHLQYALLAGRASGQTLKGGTAANENLTLESTAHATKGSILVKDNLKPFTDASYSGGWLGTDLGGASNYFRDLYMKGEARGFRLENFTSITLPAASAQNIGRLVWSTDNNKIYADIGGSWIVAGVSKFISDTVWNGSDVTKDVVVSANIQDARNAIWAIHDNSNDFERIYCVIKAISATTVRIEVSPALPAGSYRLIGLE